MSADLTTRADGTVEMAYTGKRPWHGLGVEVDHPMTAAEAIELAGLDWTVNVEPVFVKEGKQYVEVPNKRAVVRGDTREVFNVFSTTYQPVQNSDFATFFDGVVGAGEAIYETAGSLRGGRRVWMLAKLPGDLGLDDRDLLEKYILLANAHDGTMQVTMKITPVRVVCSNTLNLANLTKGDQVRFRHTTNVLNRMNDARELLGLADAYFELFMRQMERLADARFSEGDVRRVASVAVKLEDGEEARTAAAKQAMVAQIVDLYYNGAGSDLPTANGTGWGAFNAVTELLDHHLTVRGAKARNPNELAVAGQRLNVSWFGYGQDIRQRAWDEALVLAGN